MIEDSERLTYQKFSKDLYGVYVKWYTDDDVMKYITGRGLTQEEVESRFEKAIQENSRHPQMGLYAVIEKDTNQFVGIAKLTTLNVGQAEVGYGFLKPYWGKGYASEVLQNLIKCGKRLEQINELIAIVHPDNVASKNVLSKAKFSFLRKVTDGDVVSEYHGLQINNIGDDELVIREMIHSEASFLREMTFQALFVPPGKPPFPPSILDDPAIRKYYERWGRIGDTSIVMETADKELVGAAWARFFDRDNKGYGFVNEDIPEMEVAIKENFRGKGHGTLLIKKLLNTLQSNGHKSVSLSVDRLNPAMQLYKKLGFKIVKEGDNPTMQLTFTKAEL